MNHRLRRTGAVALSIGCMCLLAACGSSSKSHSGSTGTRPSGRSAPAGLKLTSSQQACLKKKGVTLPTGGFGAGRGRHGGSFKGHKFPKGKFSKGKRPNGTYGAPPSKGFAQSSKQQAALKACGVTVPSGSGGPQAAQTSTTG